MSFIEEVRSTFTQISKTLSDMFGKLSDIGVEFDKPLKQQDGSITMKLKTPKKQEFQLTIMPSKNKKYTLTFSPKNGEATSVSDVAEDKVDDAIIDYVKKTFGETITTDMLDVKSGKQLNITLLKTVTASGEVSVSLQSINANYDPRSVYSDLSTLINSDEFVDAIPEDKPTNYLAVSDDNDLTVDECATCCPNKTDVLTNLINSAYKTLMDLQFLSFNAAGPELSRVRDCCDSGIWQLQDQIRQLFEIYVEDAGIVQHPLIFLRQLPDPDLPVATSKMSSVHAVMSNLYNTYVLPIELYSCIFGPATQQQMLSWARSWQHTIKYYTDREAWNTLAMPVLFE